MSDTISTFFVESLKGSYMYAAFSRCHSEWLLPPDKCGTLQPENAHFSNPRPIGGKKD